MNVSLFQISAYSQLFLEEKNHEIGRQSQGSSLSLLPRTACWRDCSESPRSWTQHQAPMLSGAVGGQSRGRPAGPHQPGAGLGWPCLPVLVLKGPPEASTGSPFSSLSDSCTETRALTKPACSRASRRVRVAQPRDAHSCHGSVGVGGYPGLEVPPALGCRWPS